MTSSDAKSDSAALEQEVVLLRQRVNDLQRRLAGFSTPGESRAVHGINVSISEREELLAEAERIAHMGSWVWNVETNQVVWSDELYRILGYDPDKDPATVDAFFAALHPDDREQVRTRSADATKTGIGVRTEHRVCHANGAIRYVQTDGASIFDANGKVCRIVGSVLDVTEAREAERRLARSNALLEEAQSLGHMGSWDLDLENGKLQWSDEFCRILGVAPGKIGTAEIFLAHVHLEDRDRLAAIHQTVLSTGNSAQTDARIVHGNGEMRFVRIVSTAHNDAYGKPRFIRGTLLDTTDSHRLQERLAEAERMEAIGRLAGGIAHDFNNLLMVVRGNLELIGAQDRPELAAIFNAIESAQSLTSGLLAFGRKSHLQRRVLDLNELVASTVTLLGRLVGEHITLRASHDTNLLGVDVDSAMLQQALINLVINARDALVQGGVISVRTHAVSDDTQSFAELSVEDNGPGIDAATQAHLFEPFFTTKKDGKGSGLGLAMVHGTVTQHGGSVRVDSVLGRGTIFTLRIPTTTQAAPATVDTPMARMPPSHPQRTILVVEDQAEVATLLVNLLQRAGYKVLSAERPSIALNMAHEHEIIDLALCDLNMPEMHGTQLATKLKQSRPELPIVFMSGYSGDTAQLPPNARLLGKPFSFAELRAAIDAGFAEKIN